jgi:nucleoside-diphosphate-sugar epimerase
MIYISDMSQALIYCGVKPEAVGECFHIAHPEPVTVASLAATIASALGKQQPRGRIPLSVARLAAGLGDVLPSKIKPLVPLTSSRLDFLTHSRVYDVRKAEGVLGFVAPTGLSEGIRQTVAWYRDQGYLS